MIYTIRFPEDLGERFEMFRYPGGEVQVRLLDNQLHDLKGAEGVHIWATIKDGEIVALAQLLDAIEMSSVCEVVLFMPYLPYGRADRSFTKGDCIGLRVYQQLLKSLPVDRVVTLDMHNPQARFSSFRVADVSPGPLIKTVIDLIGNPTVLLPDEGAKRYGIEGIYCTKKRDSATGKLLAFSVPPVSGKVLIIDDICDGGGTFVGIAERIPNAELYLYVTHGIFSKGLVPFAEKKFKHIYTTNSFTRENPYPALLTILPCEGVMLDSVMSRDKLWKEAAR